MDKIDSALDMLTVRFDEMDIHDMRQLLKHQYVFQDFFAQHIYQQELKDGTIRRSSPNDLEAQAVEIDESSLWESDHFYAIISEWKKHCPSFRFESLGNYLLFYQAIFFKENQLAIQAIDSVQRMNAEEMKRRKQALDHQDLSSWKLLQKYFYLKGIELQNPS